MTRPANHWAFDLIGLPYERGATGPHAFCCWGLVQHVFCTRWGIQMPYVAIDDPIDQTAAIKRAADTSGWAPSGDRQPRDGDIVLMRSLLGPHVGVMIEADGRLLLLHSVEGTGVSAVPLADALASGLSGPVFWRRA
ncbi:MAG: NlpC/P60 family protein [Rubrivivax sp.]